jgi:organic hydroperoxide reductase OsmC/OhrA
MSAEPTFRATARWVGSRDPQRSGPLTLSRDLLIEAEGKPPIPASASAQYHGDDSRYNPEELMLASLAECHALTYLALAAKTNLPLIALEVRASGTLARIDGKMRFRQATLSPHTRIGAATELERATRLHESAHSHCFMTNSVNFPITVEPDVSVEG